MKSSPGKIDGGAGVNLGSGRVWSDGQSTESAMPVAGRMQPALAATDKPLAD
jgi:hypothetical protein